MQAIHRPAKQITLGGWRLSVEKLSLSDRYDSAAPGWDSSVAHYGYHLAYRYLFQQLEASLPFGGSALDAGIGTGALSAALLSTTGAPWHLHGVDISAAMLAQAEQAFPGAVLQRADLRHLPFADASFDLVMSAHALEHLPQPAEGLLELMRVLKPGGRLLVIMTRAGAGSAIGALWGANPTTRRRIHTHLQGAGLGRVQAVKLPCGSWASLASTAAFGQKPAPSGISSAPDALARPA